MTRQRKAWLVLGLDRKARNTGVIMNFRQQFAECHDMLFPRPFVILGSLDLVPPWSWMRGIQDRLVPSFPWTAREETALESCGEGLWGLSLSIPDQDMRLMKLLGPDGSCGFTPCIQEPCRLVVCIQDPDSPARPLLPTARLAEPLDIDAMNLSCLVLTREILGAGTTLELETLHALRLHKPKAFP